MLPFIARKFRVPTAALEILFGIVLFSVLGMERPEWFSLLKELGLIYLMFIAGMELDVRDILKGKRLFFYLLIPALTLLSMPLLFNALGLNFYLGISVSVFSVGIAIPVMKEFSTMSTRVGKEVLRIAITGELLSIILLTVLDIYKSHGLTLVALVYGLKLVSLVALSVVALKILYVIAWWNPERVEKVMESEDPVEEGMRAVIFLAFAGAVIAYMSDIEPILGSFMAGTIFSLVFKSKGVLEDKINAIGFGFFTPFFFIGVGADFNLQLFASAENMYFALSLALAVFVGRLYPTAMSPLIGLTFREGLSVSILISSPFSLMIIAGTLGQKTGFINSRANSSLILAALISSILYPTIYRIFIKSVRIAGE